MDFRLIGHLIGLRYKLLWAKTRTRNGKVALFFSGYLLLILVVILFALVGVGGGMAAVRLGRAERIAQGVLTALFVTATLTTVMLGFGLNQAFSDGELRRYPLNAAERRFARHFAGIADPFWILFLALYLGVAFGLYLFGAGNILLGVLAVVALFICNYVAAQVVALAIDRLMQQKGGWFILPVLFLTVAFVPQVLIPMLRKNPAAAKAALRTLAYTPTFGAGSLMTRTDAAAFYGLGLVALWILGLAALLIVLERRPPRIRVAQTSRIHWDTPFARMAAWFGPEYAPLVELWLVFLFRSKRFRIGYFMSLALVPFLLLVWSRQSARANPFAAAVGVFAVAGMTPAAAFIVNQFGYLGGGFRRYFLFPFRPAAALRATSYSLLALCSVYIVLAALAWIFFAPVAVGGTGLLMLLLSGIFGLFLFHGLGLWTTLYGPRRCDPNKTMGNDLSLAGNIVLIGGTFSLLFGPMVFGQFHKGLVTPDRWPFVLALAALAILFYFASLRRATAILPARRERLLAVVEGRAS